MPALEWSLDDPIDEALGYRPGLDGLRAVAVLLVMGFHVFDVPRNGGVLGVEIFFVLSGFLISTLLIEEFGRTGRIDLRAFYVRRALRLLPLAYAFLAVVGFATIFMSAGDRRYYLESAAACALYFGNLYGDLQGAHTDLAPALGHMWTLAVEEQFYVVWPLLLLAGLRRSARRSARLVLPIAVLLVGAVLVRLVLMSAGKTVWTLPSTYGDALLGGCALAVLRRKGLSVWTSLLPSVATVALAVSCLLPLVALDQHGGLLYLWPAALGVVCVAGELAGGWWSRVLQDGRLVYVGTISYGLYLIHWPVQVWAETVLPDLTTVVRGPLVVALSFALAAASRRWYESAFLRRKPHPVAELATTTD